MSVSSNLRVKVVKTMGLYSLYGNPACKDGLHPMIDSAFRTKAITDARGLCTVLNEVDQQCGSSPEYWFLSMALGG
eukprot:1510014-Amphidinium_carterae.1